MQAGPAVRPRVVWCQSLLVLLACCADAQPHTFTRSWLRTGELANDCFEPSVQEARPSPTQVHPRGRACERLAGPLHQLRFPPAGRAFLGGDAGDLRRLRRRPHRCPRGCGLTVLVPALPVPAVVTWGVCSYRQLQGVEMERHSEMLCPQKILQGFSRGQRWLHRWDENFLVDRDGLTDGTKGLVRRS